MASANSKNKPEWVTALIAKVGVLYYPADIGLRPEELREILKTLRHYCEAENLAHTIINEMDLSPEIIDNLISDL